jgi:RNA polymerase sigma-70 factor (ECF subfamily)
MPSAKGDERALVRRAAGGDKESIQRLFGQHRSRLKRMIAVRMDPRLSARVDPSDVVQEVLAEAARRLPAYARKAPLPFYPWLRQIAWDHLVDLHERHIRAQKRSIAREEDPRIELSDQSTAHLVEQLMDSGTSPSGRVLREELCARVRSALEQLDPRDREILVMRHLEQLQVSEIAALLDISEGAVKMRRLRAAERLRELLEGEQ